MITEIAKMIDHSLLHPAMNDEDLREGCLLAKSTMWHQFVLSPML